MKLQAAEVCPRGEAMGVVVHPARIEIPVRLGRAN